MRSSPLWTSRESECARCWPGGLARGVAKEKGHSEIRVTDTRLILDPAGTNRNLAAKLRMSVVLQA